MTSLDQKLLQEYTARISQASKVDLVIITYELIISKLEEAVENYQDGDMDLFVSSLKKAQQFLVHKIGSLNFDYKISYDLLSLYLYINDNINRSIFKLDPKALKNSIPILIKIKSGFEGIKDEDKSGSVMKNTQTIYAGLTYGKNSLNELSVDPDNRNRGYTI